VLLEDRLREALVRLNPRVPASALEEVFRKVSRPDTPSLVGANHAMHRLLVEGVPVEYPRPDGSLGDLLETEKPWMTLPRVIRDRQH